MLKTNFSLIQDKKAGVYLVLYKILRKKGACVW